MISVRTQDGMPDYVSESHFITLRGITRYFCNINSELVGPQDSWLAVTQLNSIINPKREFKSARHMEYVWVKSAVIESDEWSGTMNQ